MRFVDACRRVPVDRPPIWFMRQVGRVLPEYRAVRKSLNSRGISEDGDLAARLAVIPVERFGVDAAVVLTDPRLPLVHLGLMDTPSDADGSPGRVRDSAHDPAHWRRPRAEDFGRLSEAVGSMVRHLRGRAAVLGVVSAPFSLAASLWDAAHPSQPTRTRAVIFGQPDLWHEVAERLTEIAVLAADVQVTSGADVVHVYDSWAGALDVADYRQHVLPWSRRLFDAIAAMGVPAIHFSLGTGRLAEALRDAGGDVIGIDARSPIDEAWQRVGYDRGVQGNLDPLLLVGPVDRALSEAAGILDRAAGRPGHIFGLGHGLLPATSAGVMHTLVRYVHTYYA